LKKLYRKLFCISSQEKVSDQVFKTRTTLFVLTILACLTALSSMTFAFFAANATSSGNTIAAAYYSLAIDFAGAQAVTGDGYTFTAPAAEENLHSVALTADADGATRGYCKIVIGDETYITEQIAPGETLELKIQVDAGTNVAFYPSWGTAVIHVDDIDNEYGDGDTIVVDEPNAGEPNGEASAIGDDPTGGSEPSDGSDPANGSNQPDENDPSIGKDQPTGSDPTDGNDLTDGSNLTDGSDLVDGSDLTDGSDPTGGNDPTDGGDRPGDSDTPAADGETAANQNAPDA